VCGRLWKGLRGLLCTNYRASRGIWSPCDGVWCGSCYTQHPNDKFFRFTPHDEGSFEWHNVEDDERYKAGRDGNHLVATFQCDRCIFINLTNRLPLPGSPKDDFTLCCIRCINLDSMWGWEWSTIGSTVQAIEKTVAILAPLNDVPDYPPFGPFPLGDPLGYGTVLAMVINPCHQDDMMVINSSRLFVSLEQATIMST
jgi:hypothetical protein